MNCKTLTLSILQGPIEKKAENIPLAGYILLILKCLHLNKQFYTKKFNIFKEYFKVRKRQIRFKKLKIKEWKI